MKIDKNDPRLTAYVLNEVSNADRILIEQAMQSDAELRAEIELLKATVSVLSEVQNEPVYRLNPAQREKVLGRKTAGWNWWPALGGLATAGLAIILVLKNPVSTDSSALLEQEKTAKLEAVSESKNETAVAEAGAPQSAGGAAPPQAVQTENRGRAPEPQKEKADLMAAAAPEAAALAAHSAEESVQAPADSAKGFAPEGSAGRAANLKVEAENQDSLSQPYSLGSGAGSVRPKAQALKKIEVPPLQWLFVASENGPGGQTAIDAEVQRFVLPQVQKCRQAALDTDLVVTVRLSLAGSKVTEIRIEKTGGAPAFDSGLTECLKAGQPQSLQNSGALREYVYQLKAVSR